MIPGLVGTGSNSSAATAGINNCSAADMAASVDGAGSIRQSSREFAEQIKKLEMEGDKLREVTLASLAGNVSLDGVDSVFESGKSIHPESSVSTLIDISSEQKTISDLRSQLEQQRKETDRLHSQLLADLPPSHSFTSIPSSPSKSAFSTLPPASELSSSRNRAFEFVPPSHLERALKESQEQVSDLRRKLQESNDTAESQKRQFRANIEELKSKLHDTIVNRDTILELRQKEAASQESVISKLKSSLQQQYEKSKKQEDSLSEANKKLEALTQSCCVTETAINQIKTLLTEREKSRGKPYFDANPVLSQGTAMLAHTLERCLQEIETELDIKRCKVTELQHHLERCQSEAAQKEQCLSKEYHENLQKETEDSLKRVTQLTSEHERQLEAANERATNARKQVTALQNQLHVLQSQHDQQNRLKDELIADLESKISDLKGNLTDDRSKWHERRDVLEKNLDQLQRELSTMKSDRDESVRKCTAMELHLQDMKSNTYNPPEPPHKKNEDVIALLQTGIENCEYNSHVDHTKEWNKYRDQCMKSKKALMEWNQGSVSHLERELATEHERIKKQLQREEELRSKLLLTENTLNGRQQDVERLEKMLDVVKQECSSQLQDRVQNAEKTERERNHDQIKALTTQLSSQTEKCNKVTIELDVARTEMTSFKEQVKELTEKLESARIQLEAALSEKRHLSELVSDRKGDIERLSKEKDYYFNLLEQKNEELARVKTEKERVIVQMDEKERNLLALKQQSDNISQLVEVNSRTSENIREEKERIICLLNEKTTAVEELRMGQENMGKKMRLREKRIRDLEEERMKLTEELALKVQDMDAIHQEKENLFKELKDSRLEVATLTQAKDMIKKELSKQRASYDKEITKLQSKLKGAEHDLKLATKTLKSKDSVDNKAVRYADKMQKEITNKRGEVDSLQSKLRKFEDRLEAMAKEKMMIEKDNDSLQKSLSKSLYHTQQLTSELENYSRKNQELRDHIDQMSEALEKGDMKTATSQVQLEHLEQEIARLKIKHQLDLKETEQIMCAKIPYTASLLPPTGRLDNPMVSRQTPSSETRHVGVPTAARVGPETQHGQTENSKNVAKHIHNYTEVGHELKALLTEMRSLVAGQREITHKSNLHPSFRHSSPLQSRHKRTKESSPDLDSFSDSDVEPSWLSSRQRSHIDFSGVSSVREVHSAPQTPQRRRRRSYSAELGSLRNKSRQDSRLSDASHLSSPCRSAYTGSPYRSNDDAVKFLSATSLHNQPFPGTYTTQHASFHSLPSSHNSTTFSIPSTLFVDKSVSLTPGHDRDFEVDSFDSASLSSLTPDTQELCKRLEEKIENLTKMGGNLQRENREMADLMTVHGRKIDSVREHERKLRKSPR